MASPKPKGAITKKRHLHFNYMSPSEKHGAFHRAWEVPVRILCGGYGSGKSHSAAAEILRHLLGNPMFIGQKALVVGLTAGHNYDQLLPEFKKILTNEKKPGQNIGYIEGKDYRIWKSPLRIELPAGSEIIFKSLESGSNLAGHNVAIAFADEIDKINLDTWNEVQNRVRTVEGGFTIGTCNPSNKSHWLYERYYKLFDEMHPKESFGIADPGVWLGYLTCYDNKFLPKDVLTRYERQYSYSALERERAIMGRFVSMEGCVYNQFDRDRHTIDRKQIEIGSNWEVMVGLDFGFKDPTAALWVARDADNRFVVFREHYESEKTISYHAEILKRQDGGYIRKPSKIYSDHYSETVQTYREHGVDLTLADKGKGSIFQGIGVIQQLLADDRLLITRNCTNLIREFETYAFNPRTNEPLDRNNHACFVPGTLIETIDGPKPIEQLRIGDQVETSVGYNQILDWACTNTSASVGKLILSNGTTIECTANHPFYLRDGSKIAADQLVPGDELCTIQSKNFREKLTSYIPTNVTTVVARNMAASSDYTVLCGSISTGVLPKATMFTTKIVTERTTRLKILNVLQIKSTVKSMLKKREVALQASNNCNILLGFGSPPRLGMQVMQAESGTDSMVNWRSQFASISIIPVNNAVYHLNPARLTTLNSVPTTVRPGHGDDTLRVVRFIPNVRVSPVYNITVDRTHNYFANGVLVSNCDALRYVITEMEAKPSFNAYFSDETITDPKELQAKIATEYAENRICIGHDINGNPEYMTL
jgi:PBSX family phage terminase large subunit